MKNKIKVKIELLMMSCVEWLSVQCRCVLISRPQHTGMTQGAVQRCGALLARHSSDP